ncbi:hypothetical protein O3G_MSEX000112 [Manduca sexta]|nr:hypothetical protein O3G_MSEX000112 [Manduca sexta]
MRERIVFQYKFLQSQRKCCRKNKSIQAKTLNFLSDFNLNCCYSSVVNKYTPLTSMLLRNVLKCGVKRKVCNPATIIDQTEQYPCYTTGEICVHFIANVVSI